MFYFEDTFQKNNNPLTTIKISLIKESAVEDIVFNVNLGSIRAQKEGREVIAYWEVKEMTNHVLFYTDSNGLEFEPRVASFNKEVGKMSFLQIEVLRVVQMKTWIC